MLSVRGAKRRCRRCRFPGDESGVNDDAGELNVKPGIALWQLMVTLRLGKHEKAPDRALRAS